MQEQEWVAHLDACKSEGISLKAYAKRHGLSVDSLYWHRNGFCLWTKRLEAEKFAWISARHDVQDDHHHSNSLQDH